LDGSRRAYGSQHDRTRQMKGKRSTAEEGRKLFKFNPLREAHAKLEVIIHSDDATIHFVGRVAFVSKEEALLVNVMTESFATFRVWLRLNQLRVLENFSTAKLPQAIAADLAISPSDKIFALRLNTGGLLVISRKAAVNELTFVVAIPSATTDCAGRTSDRFHMSLPLR
jgi:hypothetical protein